MTKHRCNDYEKPPDRSGKPEKAKIKCPSCGGTGKTSFPGQKRAATCQKCKGNGWILA